ncbi:MAG TPA: 2-phospho-L-lactate guanylyltransferase [Acidimicrobiales bacterium]|nr:2-phospho-L-lactate guanylyltransferase [Acidimicrobiales bacterium]
MTAAPGRLPSLTGCVVLVPVKAFDAAKARLAPTLDATERAALARVMAERVLAAALPLPVAVVCDDPEVAAWAADHGALVLPEPGRGLNGAVEAGVQRLAAAGAAEVLVAHADLPLAHGLARLAGLGGVTLVPDRRDDGTNVVCVPTGSGFRFRYGPGSFARHVAEAQRVGLPARVVRDPELTWDVDEPADIPAGLAPPTPGVA